MRILHVLDHSIPLHSGYTFRTLSILKGQQALGWKTYHLTSSKQGEFSASHEVVEGYEFYRTPEPRGLVKKFPLIGQFAVISNLSTRLLEVAKLIKPDVIHAHSPALNAVAALWVGKRLRIPVVYEVRAFWEDAAVDHGTSREGGVRYRLTRALESYALRRVDGATTICEGLRGDIVARGIEPAKVTVIPNAVNVEDFDSKSADIDLLRAELGLEGKEVLGFIGSFYAYEGLALLLKALPRMLTENPSLHLLLDGGGPQQKELQALTTSLRVEDRVTFTGRVPNNQVQRYYDCIDILVYPRLKMRLTDLVTPLKPLEAMAQGRLIVASDVGGHCELIEDGKTGTLFKAGDAEDLARKIQSLLQERGGWTQLRRQARNFVEQERSWTASVRRYQHVYARVLKQSPTQ